MQNRPGVCTSRPPRNARNASTLRSIHLQRGKSADESIEYRRRRPSSQEIERANSSGEATRGLRSRLVAAGLQLGPLGGVLRRCGLRRGDTRLAQRPGERRAAPARIRTVFAGNSVGDVAAYQQMIIEQLDSKPAIIGHSFGGVLVQMLAGRGLAAATCAIHRHRRAACFRCRSMRSKRLCGVVEPSQPASRHHLTFEQFRYGFANAVTKRMPTSCTTSSMSPDRASRCSRRPSPTSTPRPRSRPTRPTRTVDRC